jgi:hypothetical protein
MASDPSGRMTTLEAPAALAARIARDTSLCRNETRRVIDSLNCNSAGGGNWKVGVLRLIRWHRPLHAEIRAGELLAQMAKTGERATIGRPEKRSQETTIKLADLGITKTQSSNRQRLAAMPKEEQEAGVARTVRPPGRAQQPEGWIWPPRWKTPWIWYFCNALSYHNENNSLLLHSSYEPLCDLLPEQDFRLRHAAEYVHVMFTVKCVLAGARYQCVEAVFGLRD